MSEASIFSSLFAPHRTVTITNVIVIPLSIILVYLAVKLAASEEKEKPVAAAINCLMVFLGGMVGWALAMFWIPYDDTEKSAFAQVGATVSAFVSGYAISKFDKLLEATLFDGAKPVRATIIRIALFISAVLLAAVVLVTNRVDWVSTEADRKAKDPVELAKKAETTAKAASAASAAAAASKAALATPPKGATATSEPVTK